MLITQTQIDEARAILKGKVHRTPLVPATTIGQQFGAQLYLKCENLQRTGSFKPRGALNKVAHLSAEEKAKGLIAVSAGNHAQGVAYAAQREGLKATIVMPENAPQAKADATRGYGARSSCSAPSPPSSRRRTKSSASTGTPSSTRSTTRT